MIAHLSGVSRRRTPAASNSRDIVCVNDTIRVPNAAGKLELKLSGSQQAIRAALVAARVSSNLFVQNSGISAWPRNNADNFHDKKDGTP